MIIKTVSAIKMRLYITLVTRTLRLKILAIEFLISNCKKYIV